MWRGEGVEVGEGGREGGKRVLMSNFFLILESEEQRTLPYNPWLCPVRDEACECR